MLKCSGHWRWKDLWKTQNASSVGDKWLSVLLTIPDFSIAAILLLGIQISQRTVQTHYRKMATVFLSQAQSMKGIHNEEEHVWVNISFSTCVKAI